MRRIMKLAATGLLAVVGLGAVAQEASAQPGIPRPYPNPGPFPPAPLPYPPGPGYPGPDYPRPRPPRPVDTDYIVLVRHAGHWDRHGRYETYEQARRAEFYLERQGRQARIVPVRDYTPDFPRW